MSVKSETFSSRNLNSIKSDMESIWSGTASEALCSSLNETILAINDTESYLVSYDSALSLLDTYKRNENVIKEYEKSISYEQNNPSVRNIRTVMVDGESKNETFYTVNHAMISLWTESMNSLINDNVVIKKQIEELLSSILPNNLQPKNNTDIAHRGSKFDGERNNYKIGDNSLDAFINAGRNGFWGAEADVIQAPDGSLVCSHNAVKKGENPISFEQYLDVCKEYGMTAIIDMKYSNGWSKAGEDEYVSQILATIEDKGMMDSCVIQTNNKHDITNVRSNSEEARIWFLTDDVSKDNIEFIKDNGVECVNTKYTDNTTSRVTTLKNNDINICVWNVFSEKDKNFLLDRGATYIMSDNVLGITPYQEGEEDYNDIVN